MSKQQKETAAPYTKAERRAEAEIDQHLLGINPSPARNMLEQLRELV